MSLKGFYLLPHPPIILPEVGNGEEQKINKTADSMDSIGRDIAKLAPDTIIIVTPHGTMFQDAIVLSYEEEISGSMKNFGAPRVSLKLPVQKKLTQRIYDIAQDEGIPSILATSALLKKYNAHVFIDHGSIVPLYFVNRHYSNYKLVHVTYAPLSDVELYKFGIAVNKAVEELGEEAVLIASGDLSHRLKEDGPYEYDPSGEMFDREFLESLQKGDVKRVFSIDKKVICDAGECGRRSAAVMLGALEGRKFKGDLLSYEGTFGVGYGVMKFDEISEDTSRLDELQIIRKKAYERKNQQSDPYVKLARESLTTYLETGKELNHIPDYVTEEMKKAKRGLFVSLKKNGELRGCIGTIFPVTDSIAEEILRNAIEAGINDPRFYEVEADELMDIDFSVDALTEPEPANKSELNPAEYGVIVRCGGKTGLLLPDLEGVDTVEEQLSIALSKAGIPQEENYSIQKFKVIRHKEE